MTEKSQSSAFRRYLQFMGWPVVAGILLAVVVLQYQQIDRLADPTAGQESADTSGSASQGEVYPPLTGGPVYSFASAVRRAAPSVISIHSTIRQQLQLPPPEDIPPAFRNWLQSIPSERSWNSLGSGVAVSNQGHILTALHVIQGADNIEVRFQENGGGKTVITDATVIGTDQNTDLALLKVDSDSLPPPIPIGSSADVQVGDAVLAIGYPSHELISQKSVSQGIVSALGIPQNGLPVVEYIQTDAAINYGNSGGALVDAFGNLIGINSFIYSQSGGSDGIGFAVPVNKAMFVMEQLIEHGEVTPGYLGVVTGELLTEETSREFFGRPDITGLLVEQVNAASPAEEAGIRPGDVMVEIDGQPIDSVISAIDQINRKTPGERADLLIYRSGDYQTITVTLGTGTAQYLEARTEETPDD